MAAHPVPADRSSWSRFDELQDRNDETLRRILEAAAANPTTDTRQIGDYYGSCMDERGIDAAGITPLRAGLDAIASFSDLAALPSLLARLHPIGVNAFFRFGSARTSRNDASWRRPGPRLPDRDYYFRRIALDDLRREYVATSAMSQSSACHRIERLNPPAQKSRRRGRVLIAVPADPR